MTSPPTAPDTTERWRRLGGKRRMTSDSAIDPNPVRKSRPRGTIATGVNELTADALDRIGITLKPKASIIVVEYRMTGTHRGLRVHHAARVRTKKIAHANSRAG